jgi:RNA recognition motif-containing protein
MGTRIFVGNLSFEATEEDLRDLFSAADREVQQVSIVKDRDSGRSRGFGFVEMASAPAASAAITELDGKQLYGRPLRVNAAHDRPKHDRSSGDRQRY